MSDQVPMSPFVCSVHKYHPDGSKPLGEQEDAWYQHLRDEEHECTYSKPCQNCAKKCEGKTTAKVPQPTPDVKNPRSITVFCSKECKTEYLANLGVTA